MVLIVSSEQDDHAQRVQTRLRELGKEARLLDLAKFPEHLHLVLQFAAQNGAPDARFGDTEFELPLSQCKAVWWRRPQPFTLHRELANGVNRSFAELECHSAIAGLWLLLDTFWINHPTRDEEASRKPYQLKIAREEGLLIPPTLITNSPERAREFVARHGHENVIYKSFYAVPEAWRETRRLRADEVNLLGQVRYAPVIFQEYVPAECDLRVTVVGEKVFTAAIFARETDYEVDYRMEMSRARVDSFRLPTGVLEHLLRLMKRLGLAYGAIDLRLTPSGDFVFLEVNPSGQWLFIEDRTALPITEAFVELLLSR